MSAYIVDRNHIVYLVKFAEKCGALNYINLNSVELANELSKENVASVNGRYPETAQNINQAPGDLTSIEPFTKSELAKILYTDFDAVQILKSCNCYEYQSCEHDGWEKSKAKQAIERIKSYAIYALPKYNEAEWGAPAPYKRVAK